MDHAALADALLGPGARPFAHFRARPGMVRTRWFKSYFAQKQGDLARTLAREHLHVGGYVVELGSYLGDSAIAWAQALEEAGVNASVVCIDTWTGDVPMWRHTGRMLGHPEADGQPRLYEQYMFNVRASGYSHRILPLRVSATVGLGLLHHLVARRILPPPALIFLDAAHEYPETLAEIQAAWRVLSPGGFLIGDDYDAYWPAVQQSVNHFLVATRPDEVANPGSYARAWPFRLEGVTLAHTEGELSAHTTAHSIMSKLLLKRNCWILRKALAGERGRFSTPPSNQRLQWPPKVSLTCCLNGWIEPTLDAQRTRCRKLAPLGLLDSCFEQGGWSKDTLPCRMAFACKMRTPQRRQGK